MPDPKILFRHNHPLLFTLLVLASLSFLFFGGVIIFIATITSQTSQAKIFGLTDGIGIISLKGIIVSAEETLTEISSFREDNRIKAIVVRIDSPGGTVGASQEIYQELKRTNKVKPVIASMGSVAASGGYYAALGAQQILASQGTLTGSIGVILKFANLKEIFDKIGYKPEVIKSGIHKDIGSSSRPMSQEEKDLLQSLIDNVHNQFITAVTEERSLSREEVVRLADGRIYSGEQAKHLGLIDTFGNFTDAVILAAKLAGLDTTNLPALIYPKESGFSLLRFVVGERAQSSLENLFGHYPAIVYEWSLIH